MKDFFKPEDFNSIVCYDSNSPQMCAALANEKLNALIESWSVVYNYNEGLSSWWNPKEMVTTADNPVRQARLAFIEEIVKEPCVHPFSHLITFRDSPHKAQCGICKVELQATWKPVDTSSTD